MRWRVSPDMVVAKADIVSSVARRIAYQVAAPPLLVLQHTAQRE